MSDAETPLPSEKNSRDEHRDLNDLGDKLRKVQAKRETKKDYARSDDEMSQSGLGVGLRIGTELIVGVLMGVAIGWSFDRALGTDPWGLLIFFVLGFVAGILNVIRSANKALADIGNQGESPEDPNE